MIAGSEFRHLGGGRKGLFLLLRYLFIITASYLLIFQSPRGGFVPLYGLMIAVALASNVALSVMSPQRLFSWYVEAPVLIADTLWVAWALHLTGTEGQAFFLLYFFVLLVAALGESLGLILLGSTLISIANLYFSSGPIWTAPQLLRVVFFYSVALFYGNALSQIKRERQRADKGVVWAKELEAKVAERTEELRWLYQESLVASRLKSEFVANVSHELRTPLHQIIGYGELLREGDYGPLTARQLEPLRVMDKSAHGLLEMINATLDVGRIDAGQMPLDLKEVALPELIAEIDAEIRPAHDKPDVSLAWTVGPDLSRMCSDPAKLKTILRNLILNALKFTDHGSVTVSVEARGDDVEIAVTDTGIGIAPEARCLIFEPFRQADNSSTRSYGGVGLGLYLVHRLVQALGGSISVESEVGRGSVFRVRLPARIEGTDAAAHSATPVVAEAAAPAPPHRGGARGVWG